MKYFYFLVWIFFGISIFVSNTENIFRKNCTANASTSTNSTNTAELNNEKPLLLNEISLKNSSQDWIELKVYSQDTKDLFLKFGNENININKISAEKQNIKFIVIYLNSTNEKVETLNGVLYFYSTAKGLTSTSETITLEKSEKIIDTLCWYKSPVSKSTQEKIQKIVLNKSWTGPCLKSETIKTNQSIIRVNDFKFAEAWKNSEQTSPGEENTEKQAKAPTAIITVEKGELIGAAPLSINLDGSKSNSEDKRKLSYKWIFPENIIVEKKNPATFKINKTGTHFIKLKVQDDRGLIGQDQLTITVLEKQDSKNTFKNGTLSKNIHISEIFPNPKGIDTGKEWIEIYNSGNSSINLGNWKLIINKKEFLISDQEIIPSKSHLLITKTNKKLALNNNEGTIVLRDFTNSIIDQMYYSSTKEDMSVSHVTIKNGEKIKTSLENTTPTPNFKNTEFEELEGIIVAPAKIEKDFFFEFQKKGEQVTVKIIFDLKDFKFDFMEKAISKNTNIKLLVEKLDENKYKLHQFIILSQLIDNENEQTKTLAESKKNEQSKKWLLLGASICLVILVILSAYRRHRNKLRGT